MIACSKGTCQGKLRLTKIGSYDYANCTDCGHSSYVPSNLLGAFKGNLKTPKKRKVYSLRDYGKWTNDGSLKYHYDYKMKDFQGFINECDKLNHYTPRASSNMEMLEEDFRRQMRNTLQAERFNQFDGILSQI